LSTVLSLKTDWNI